MKHLTAVAPKAHHMHHAGAPEAFHMHMHHADTVTPENCHTHSAGGPRVPLSFVRAGKEATVQSVSGKDETKRFLGSLGLVEGAHVCVISEMNGDVIVKVKGTRVAISKSMARRVMTV